MTPTQSHLCVFVSIGSYDLTEINTMEIPFRVGLVADGLGQCVRNDIVAVYGAALVVDNAFLDNGRAHFVAGNGGKVRFLKLVVIAPGYGSAVAGGRRQLPRGHIHGEVADLLQAAVSVA